MRRNQNSRRSHHVLSRYWYRILSLLTVVGILSLTFFSIVSSAVDIEQSTPALMAVEGPQDASQQESDLITVSQEDLESTDHQYFNDVIIDDLKSIFQSFTVTVTVGDKTYEIETIGGTVRDAVDECFTIGEGDQINYPLSDPLSDGMNIIVTDIEQVVEVKQTSIDFETEVVYSSDHYAGQTVVIPGEKGLKEFTYRYTYVNGRLTDTELVKEEIIRQPVNAKTVLGTKQSSKTYLSSGISYISSLLPEADFALDDNYRPVSYSKLIRGTASAYSSDPYTATGKRCRTGYVAVNPSIIPYHTKMYIVCSDNSYFYGYASAEDTGGFIHWGTRVVDLYLNSEAECVRFGLRPVEMYLFN